MSEQHDILAALARLETELAALRAEVKTELDALRAEVKAELGGVARNIELAALTRLVRQALDGNAMLRAEQRIGSATMQQLVATVGGFANLLQALVDQQQRLSDRVERIETAP